MNRVIFLLILWHISLFLPIINIIEAQGLRLIVDNSVFETLPEQDPFTPRVPVEEIQVPRVEPVRPVVAERPVMPPSPPPTEPPPIMPPVQEVLPPPIPEEPLPAINISGLVWNTKRPQAIIDGRIVEIGDMVSGVKIVDIQKGGITVLFQDRTQILEVKH